MDRGNVKDRLQTAYKYLYDTGKVHSVTELADKMMRARSSVSRALGGSSEYLNEKFLKAFTNTFGMISYEWLLDGSGNMLLHGNSDNSVSCSNEEVEKMKTRMAEKDELITTQRQLILALQDKISELKAKLKVEGFDNFPFQQDNKDAKELNLVQL